MLNRQKQAFVAITLSGAEILAKLAPQLPEADFFVSQKFYSHLEALPNGKPIEGTVKAAMGELFHSYEQLVCIVSIGAVVRLLAPHLKSKETDPGVIVLDDEARYVIPVLSGHVGGANAFAAQLAEMLGATAVMTTASEVGKTIPVDILGRELGWQVEAPKVNLVRVAAHVVNREPVALVQEAGSRDWWKLDSPIPANISRFDQLEEVDLSKFKALLWITDREVPSELWESMKEGLVVYHPPLGQK